jgi:NADH:ubiquinone oxidoreductase subunit 5 (subunit L)/multisubunit Na+/H+ antiporter MnhA subunit
MSATTYAWLVIAFPLAGSIVIALFWPRLPGRTAGWIGSAAIGLAFVNAYVSIALCGLVAVAYIPARWTRRRAPS